MCGRYFVAITEQELKDAIEQAQAKLERESRQVQIQMKMGGEIFPTDVVPVRTKKSGYLAMKWGFAMGEKKQIINARSETAAEKPFFGYGRHRCIVPASWYFEWETLESGGKPLKTKHTFRLPDRPVLYMAGLCRMEKDADVPSFVIVTKAAVPAIRHIHDRMPVLIPESRLDQWLDDYGTIAEAIQELAVSNAE